MRFVHLAMGTGAGPAVVANRSTTRAVESDAAVHNMSIVYDRRDSPCCNPVSNDLGQPRVASYVNTNQILGDVHVANTNIPVFSELTLNEIIDDPLIALLNESDKIDCRSFAQLLHSAARVSRRQSD